VLKRDRLRYDRSPCHTIKNPTHYLKQKKITLLQIKIRNFAK
jgi:hypothetical protein